MLEQDAAERITNFDEVALGYTEELMLKEASRCLHCKEPTCVDGCPVSVPIKEFIALLKAGDYAGAAAKIKEKNALPAVCGRVCPQESQCEKVCVLAKKQAPVAIGRLERFAADFELANGFEEPAKPAPTGKKVAIIGSGPAGLTAAADLAKRGHAVTVFEALHKPGGVLVYGIPEFRLPKRIVEAEVENIEGLGVEIRFDSVAGRLFTIDGLFEEGFEAVFIGTGAGLPMFMGIPGENLNGVYSANEYLTRTNLMKAYLFPEYDTPIKRAKRVAVVGGGNVAMDSARTALRLGAEKVYLIYRRSEAEMPARKEELDHAKEEGIDFRFLTNPKQVLGEEGWVAGLECVAMELGEPDESGRRRPIEVPGSEFTIEVDAVIMAIGTKANPIVPTTTPGLDVTSRGYIAANEETGATSRPAVFAGGDIVTGSATVILAMGAGRKAADAIHDYLTNSKP
ncbi:MAG: NADPH-dependent glutamate synthase [Actinobacteria bacterium]|nr:NADPH-dependent glutamate synthase [Actinomycetota bacterium]